MPTSRDKASTTSVPAASKVSRPSSESASTTPRDRGRPRVVTRVRFWIWIALVVSVCVALPVWSWLLRDGLLLDRTALLRLGGLTTSGLALIAFILLATTPVDAVLVSTRLGKRLLLTAAAVACGCCTVLVAPVLDADVLRTRADGYVWLNGTTPYATPPAEIRRDGRPLSPMAASEDPFARDEAALDAATPDASSASREGPAVQAIAAGSRAIDLTLPVGSATGNTLPAAADWRMATLELPWWRRMTVLRGMLAIAFLLTVGEMIAWLRQREQSVWWAALFAWPAATWFGAAGQGATAVLGTLFLVAGLRRLELLRPRRAALSLAAAVAVWPVAVIAFPFAIRVARGADEASRKVRFATWYGLTLALLFIPPLSVDGGFGGYWSALLSHLLTPRDGFTAHLFGDLRLTWALCLIATVLIGALTWLRRLAAPAATYLTLMTALLLAPIASPWLVAWPLALAPIFAGRGGLAALVWSGTIAAAGFQAGGGAGIYAPVVVAFIFDGVVILRRPVAVRTMPGPIATADVK